MKAEVAFAPLLAATRALKPYTVTHGWSGASRSLHLHAHADMLTRTATTGDETAQVDLTTTTGGGGWCAVAPDTPHHRTDRDEAFGQGHHHRHRRPARCLRPTAPGDRGTADARPADRPPTSPAAHPCRACTTATASSLPPAP
jgi:hypothetical protein